MKIFTTLKVIDIKVVGCAFSDHKFLVSALDFSKTKHTPFLNKGRSLTEIADLIKSVDLSFNKNDQDIDQIWMKIKQEILECIDLIAPLKKFRERPIEIATWADEELLKKLDFVTFIILNFRTQIPRWILRIIIQNINNIKLSANHSSAKK